jgi:hypothetical protein
MKIKTGTCGFKSSEHIYLVARLVIHSLGICVLSIGLLSGCKSSNETNSASSLISDVVVPGDSVISMSLDTSVVAEGGASVAHLTLTRVSGDGDVVLHFGLSGTADVNDLVGFQPIQVMQSGELEKIIPLLANDDSIFEGTERLTITLEANASFRIEGPASVQLTISDNETMPVVSLTQTGGNILTEGSPAGVTLNWSIPTPLSQDLIIYNWIGDITQIDRHSPIPATITIPRGSTSYSLFVTAIDNHIFNATSTQLVCIYDSLGYRTQHSHYQASFSIVDNGFRFKLSVVDGIATEAGPTPGSFRITKEGATAVDHTVTYTVIGTATPGVDFVALSGSVVFPGGSSYVDIPVTVMSDAVLDPGETVVIQLTSDGSFDVTTDPAEVVITDLSSNVVNTVVFINAVLQESPPKITLKFENEDSGATYTVYKKDRDATSWGPVLANLPAGTFSYVDSSVVIGQIYEYRVDRSSGGVGYVTSGIKVPMVDQPGTIILIVGVGQVTPLATEIAQFVADLEAEGWRVIRHDLSGTPTVPQVKSLIVADYALGSVKGVVLFGSVPVPYSGLLNPDGHPDHLGAWPADVYYADMDGSWTDSTVNYPTPSRPKNINSLGDGRFDQSELPSDTELFIGRVDLSDMPSFTGKTENDLLRRYLAKNHSFRKGTVVVPRRALVDDNFGYFGGEAFAATSWLGFSEVVRLGHINLLDWFTTLPSKKYLFAHGNGGGSFTSAASVGTTDQFVANESNAVFTTFFGSYFGDWNTTNNFLRAPLAAAGLGLTSLWTGRPKWYLHHMGLGETIGYSAKKSQNNSSTYVSSFYARSIHMALMGDPSLRAFIVRPPSGVITQQVGSDLKVNWTPSLDTVIGYHVFVKKLGELNFTRVTAAPLSVATTNYTYLNPTPGTYDVLVRALQLEISPSGSFYNLSSGERASQVIH